MQTKVASRHIEQKLILYCCASHLPTTHLCMHTETQITILTCGIARKTHASRDTFNAPTYVLFAHAQDL